MLLESFQMFPIFLSNKKCRLEHVVNKLMSCLITEFLWIFSYKMHGILSKSMDTLWHSFHGTPSVLQGNSWHSMELYDIPWNFMDLHQYFMEFRGTSWYSMEPHGYSLDTPWKFHGIPWISLMRWWNSMEFHGGISHGKGLSIPAILL